MATPDQPDKPKHPTAHLAPYQWKPGQAGGGGAEGGKQTARWRRAINAAVTDQDCEAVIKAMRNGACGVLAVKIDKEGGTAIYEKAPDPACARVFFEVLRVIGPGAQKDEEIDEETLKKMPDEVVKWIAEFGKGN